MDIATLINQKQVEVITTRGYEPKSVYLGQVEMDALLLWAQNQYGFESKPNADDGNEFLGMKCYQVNVESHLNVA